MKLCYDKNSKDPTYFVQHGFRNGKKTSTKNVKRIGKHSDLLHFVDDPLAFATEEVVKYNLEFKSGKVVLNLKVDFDEKLTATRNIASKSSLLNVGYFILQKIYHDLKISNFFKKINNECSATFNCNDINRFLSFSRILDPRSKWGTFDKLDTYYERPTIEYQHMLRFMDILAENYDPYLEYLCHNSSNVVKRNFGVCYFDCTNYYFETESEDPDYTDEVTGEIMKGLRKYGHSKQHQPNPLVQMGLFMDGNGIPISMSIRPGSENEQKFAIPFEKKITKMFEGKPFIYCADAGLSSLDIRQYNSFGGRAFIVTQSVKKLSVQLQQAVFNDFDYRRLSDNSLITIKYAKEFDRKLKENLSLYNDVAYKVLNVNRPVDIGLREEKTYKNGGTRMVKSKATLKQRLIVTFSRKMMEYQRTIRNGQIDRAKNIIARKAAEEVKRGPHDVTRFIKRISATKNGEIADDYFVLDKNAIAQEEKYDGYYAVVTNLDDDAKSILKINANRYKIEDCFRVLKTNFRARPIYHRITKRIIAHFMICYTALLIYRLLESKLEQFGSHFTTENILETLRNMNVANINDEYYMSVFSASEVCTALNGIYDMGLDKKNYRPKELNKSIKKISK